jgi:hypothetical protein
MTLGFVARVAGIGMMVAFVSSLSLAFAGLESLTLHMALVVAILIASGIAIVRRDRQNEQRRSRLA